MIRDAAPAGAAPADAATQPIDANWVASGLRARVLVPLGLALLLLVTILGVLTYMSRMEHSKHQTADAAVAVNNMLEERTAHEVLGMQSILQLLMDDPRLQAAQRARDRDALLALAVPVLEGISARNGISHLYFILPDRTTLLRAHEPGHAGDRIERFTMLEAERTGRPAWGHEQGPHGSFTLRVVHPWEVDGERIGYMELGLEFEDIVADIKQSLKANVFVVLEKRFVDEAKWKRAQAAKPEPIHWNEFPGVVMLSRTTGEIPPGLKAYLSEPQGQHFQHNFETEWGGRFAQVIATPLGNLRGQEVGELLVMNDLTVAVGERREAIVSMVLVSAAIGGTLMLFFYVLLGRVQRDVAARTARLQEARLVLASEQQERQRAERELALQQERNELLEARGRMVEQLDEARRTAEAALRQNEEVTASLRETQSELVATARQAGRAEIATNVLHNVGNVLNSVNVSAGLIVSILRNSRVGGLSRAMELMAANKGDLGGYLSADEKGRMLPGYLASVTDALVKERDGVLDEVGRLTKSVDHIKDIVATQQSHAAGGDVIEPVEASELVEEALRMQGTALARHQVTVVREYETVPRVPLDRGRVLQILVNLISNAKAAGTGQAHGRPNITLRVEMADPGRLRFLVRDEGEGIAAENLTRIFSHGFTTRKDGHGFGLHSSALAARQMGGTLAASSEGPGRGATFTLELPVTPPPVSVEAAATAAT